MNTGDYLLEIGKDEDLAIITEEAGYTYHELRSGVDFLVFQLERLGVKPGERVGLFSQNSFFWVAAYLAILKFEAVAVPLPVQMPAGELAAYLEFTGCKALFVQSRLFNKVMAGADTSLPVISDDLLKSWAAGLGNDSGKQAHKQGFIEHSLASLMLTSGTTSRQRAVMATHRNIQANTESILSYLGLDRSDRIMVVLPFYYCFGTSLLHTHLRAGGSLVLSNKFTFPETVLDRMQSTGCTGFAGVPSTYQILLRSSTFARREFPGLRKLQQAGGKLPDPLIQELVAAVPQADVFIMYGQTEATARLSYLPPQDLKPRLGSIGKGIPGVSLQVLDENGAPVKPGQVGEIVARGENISPGYWRDPEASAEKFAQGALMTGDLATIDDDGYIYIVDRKSDFIKTYGYRVSSQQVESCLLELPEVSGAAVIGEPDPVQGEAIVAYLTLPANSDLTSEEILAHCRQRLARYMVPERVIVLPELPLNAHGKVNKNELRKLSDVRDYGRI